MKRTTLCIMLILGIIISIPEAMAKPKTKKKEKEGGIKVRLGKTIKREYKKVLKDKYAYGPKQEYDKKTKLTHIWLPYGDNKELYAHTKGIFKNPSPENGMSTFHSADASSDATLTYKIEFDRPIGEFTLNMANSNMDWKKEQLLESNTALQVEVGKLLKKSKVPNLKMNRPF